MRIGMMLDVYKPYISGVTNFVSLNKRQLEAFGHQVSVFTFGDPAYPDDEPNVVRSPGLPLNLHNTGLHLSFRHTGRARREIQSMDIIHVHHPFISGPLALLYGRSRRIPVVFTNHTRYDLYAEHYLPRFQSRSLGTSLLRLYLPAFTGRCDLVIAPSAGLGHVLRRLGVQADMRVIPNGIPLAPFQSPACPRTRAELDLPDEGVVLMYVGRVSTEKNLAFLLEAFFAAASAQPALYLVVVGGGSALAGLRAQAAASAHAGRVRLTGHVDYADLPGYLAAADAFVTASQTEVHPLSLIEALAAGKPALGIHSPGISDTLEDGQNGLLSGPDVENFTAVMLRLARDAELRGRLAEGARRSAARYDIRVTARRLEAEYLRLAGDGRRDSSQAQ